MYKLKVVVLFLILNYSSFSQTTLKGWVKDSLQTSLSYANVIAKPKDSVHDLVFSITDKLGNYQLLLEKGKYTISVSYLGFSTHNFEYSALKNTIKNIILKKQGIVLDEVLVEPPMLVKQDTIVYTIKKFVKGNERKLKNVLNKLPGVEIDKDDQITVFGKKVTIMLVENRAFFGGDTKLAIDNIPADVIDKIEVIDNYSKIAFLKNLSDNNEMAINVKLKEDKKSFVFGDVEAGKGNQNFYNTHGNLFYYSTKTNLNFIGNLNNTAEKTFTFKDYLNFQGGINSVFERGSKLNLSNSDFSQFLVNKNLTSSNNRFGALNITQEVNNNLNISCYGIFSHSKDKTFEQSANQYNLFDEAKSVKSTTKNILGIGKLTFDYVPNLEEQWYFNTQFKKINNASSNSINSIISTLTNQFLTNKEVLATYFNQNIEWHKSTSTKNKYSFIADFIYDKNNPITFWETNNPILEGLIPLVNQPIYRLRQLKESKKNNLDIVFKHYWVINKNNHIYSTIGNTHLTQHFLVDDSQELVNGSVNSFNDKGFGNALNFKLNDLFFGIHYKFRKGVFTFKQGFFLHSYHWKINQLNQTQNKKVVILPNFLSKIEFSQLKKIQFSYKLETLFSDASKFANQFYLQSYNTVFRGNETLTNELYHSLRLRYSQSKMYRGISIYVSGNYIKKAEGINNAVNYQGINQSINPVLIKNQNEKWIVRGSANRVTKNIKYSLYISHISSKYLQKVNNILETNKNNNTSTKLSLKTLYENFPTVEIGYSRNISRYILSNSSFKFIIHEPYITFDYDFLNGFNFNFNYTTYNYINSTFELRNSYEILNASFFYKKDNSRWSYNLVIQNMLDFRFIQGNRFSDYLVSDTKTFIMPRIIMFKLSYKL